MNADQCRGVMDNLHIIAHVANGGEVEYAHFDYRGVFTGWGRPTTRVLLNNLGGYRIRKARVRVCACCNVMYPACPRA